MNAQIEKLLVIQDLDLRLRAAKTRLETIPIEIKKIQTQIELDKKNFTAQKENLLSEELEIKKVEATIKEKEEHIRKLQSQSSMVRKNDEYRALMGEIDNIRKAVEELETQQLVLMDKISENKSKVKDLDAKLKNKEKQANEEIKEMQEIEEKIKTEISRLKSEREKLLPTVDTNILSLYERILSKGRGIPVAEVKNSICSNCHLRLTPHTANQARKDLIVQCDNCSHIIYFLEK